MNKIPASLKALMSNLIDYAGLFPPAGLPMQQAVENYARYLAGPDAWALARFILPVSRFAEFEAAMANVSLVEPWGISALLGSNPEADMAAIEQFNERNKHRAIVDAVEVKASSSEEIAHIRAFVRGTIIPYFEIPAEKAAELIPTIGHIRGRAKIRTGGVTPEAFPSVETVASFILESAKNDVPFKATAGLHHPIRCVKPLTYEPGAPTGTMHGFVNVFLAAAGAWANGRDIGAPHGFTMHHDVLTRFVVKLLGESHFEFCDDKLKKPFEIPIFALETVRRDFAISFGSCSFEDPLADLRELKLL